MNPAPRWSPGFQATDQITDTLPDALPPAEDLENDLDILAERARFRRDMEDQVGDELDYDLLWRQRKKGAFIGFAVGCAAGLVCFLVFGAKIRTIEEFGSIFFVGFMSALSGLVIVLLPQGMGRGDQVRTRLFFIAVQAVSVFAFATMRWRARLPIDMSFLATAVACGLVVVFLLWGCAMGIRGLAKVVRKAR